MKLLSATLGLAAVLALSGFSGCTTLSSADQVKTACATRAAAVDTLATAREAHLLSEAQVAEIDTLKAQTIGPCIADAPDWSNVTRPIFDAAIARLVVLKTDVEN